MRTAVLRHVAGFEIEECAAPRPGDGGVLVEMWAVGTCGSDVAAFRGRHPLRAPPVVLGHQGAGRVVEAGTDTALPAGARVAVLPLVSCRRCGRLEQGPSHLCAHRRSSGAGLPGILSRYVVVPQRALVPLADGLAYGPVDLFDRAAGRTFATADPTDHPREPGT
ncbi:alcohol dehydrogenase catalytic domain-containing protein [Streptomyces tendae]|uniref:alcohol dehydrogenase catalytic domain-containing protein n=1 Tax=Streptomyces tendae TaxID=1932 RepID=UPI0036A22D8E